MFHVPEEYRDNTNSSKALGNNGHFRVPLTSTSCFFCQASDGGGWEHVSISLREETAKGERTIERCPSWDEMCFIKQLFWDDSDWVAQFHPPEKEYVRVHPYCLHLWRPSHETLVTPPSLMVGQKIGQSPQELAREITAYLLEFDRKWGTLCGIDIGKLPPLEEEEKPEERAANALTEAVRNFMKEVKKREHNKDDSVDSAL